MQKFERGLTLARKATGYKGSYQEYVNLQYSGYVQICKRCEIKPLSKAEWLENQT